MSEHDSNRLDKTVNRVDESLTRLTILEERLQQITRNLEHAFESIDTIESSLQEIEKRQAVNQTKIGMNERIVWMFISAVVGLATYFIKAG